MRKTFGRAAVSARRFAHAARGAQGLLGAAFIVAGVFLLTCLAWALVVAGGFLLLGAWGS